MRRIVSIVASMLLACGGLTLGTSAIASAAEEVSTLISVMNGMNSADRQNAADQLADLGSAAKPAVAALARAVADPDAELRWRAARALGAIGPDASAAVPALIIALGDSETLVRAQAAHALRNIGQATPEVGAALAAHVTDPAEQVRREIFRALRVLRVDPAIVRPALIKALNSADPARAAAAIQTFTEQGEAAVPRLIEGLKHQESQYWACLALGELGPAAKDAVPPLAELLSSDRPDIVLQALVALAQIGPAAQSAVPQIMPLVKSPTTAVQLGAAFALGKLRVVAATAELKQLSQSANDPLLKTVAAWALANIHPDAAAAALNMAEVISALKNEDARVRAWSAASLGELTGPWTADVIPALIAALKDRDRTVSANAARSLETAGMKAVQPLLTALDDAQLRSPVLSVLSKIGPDAAAAAPGLAAALISPDPEYRRELLFTLGAIGPRAAPVTELVAAHLQDAEMRVRYAACFALGRFGPSAQAAVDKLNHGLAVEDAFLPVACAWALLKIKPDDKDLIATTVPRLASALSALSEMPKLEVIRSLGELGAEAKSAQPALTSALQDPNSAVRDAAREALQQINGKG